MESLSTLTEQLDDLLNNTKCEEGNDLTTTDQQTHLEEQAWVDIDDDVTDYLSYLSSDAATVPNSVSDQIFPRDIVPSVEDKVHKPNHSAYITDKLSSSKNGDFSSIKHRKNKKKSWPSAFEKGFTNSQEFAAAKIVELSKKVRELNAQLISTQNKLRLEETKVRSLNESKSKEITKPKDTIAISDDSINEYEKQIKDLTEKLNVANVKLCESRNQAQQQKHELKLLQKALNSEVGENISIQTLTSDGWRGRAQQILSLQQKVHELNEKLSQSTIPISERSMTAIQVLEKAQDKERISSLTNELEETKATLSDIRNKYEQGKARIKVLTNELNSLKAKYEALSMKNEEDVKLINTLTARLTTISQKCHEREQNLSAKYEEQINAITTDFKQEKLKADQLKKIVIDRDSMIEKLEAKLTEQKQFQLGRNDIQGTRPPSSWSTFERPPSRMSLQSSTCNVLPSTEVERMRLMELVTVLNKRLDNERRQLEKVQDQLRQEKQRTVKLETKCNRLELEKVGKGYRRSASNLSSCSDVSRVELATAKDRCALLEEKCLALESRLERLRQEKEEDSRIYVSMVEEARQALKDHLRKSVSSNASLP